MFGKLTEEEYKIIDSFESIVDDALQLKRKQKQDTQRAIRELFQELTSEREGKNIDYLSEPCKLSAYVYYYLWWNLLRLVRLFNSLSFNIKAGDVIGDFGSGPLTFLLALWIAKPELRDKALTFYCVDISEKAMKIGEKIFRTLASFTSREKKSKCIEQNKKGHNNIHKGDFLFVRWKIKIVSSPFGIPIKEKLDFFFSANMFNEICWKHIRSLKIHIEKKALVIDSYLKDSARVLIIEPGIPIGGKIISSFRNFLLKKKNYSIISPCPHSYSCPLHESKRGGNREVIARGKWCHFSFSTLHAPSHLLEFSEKVHLPKKTASLSYLYCSKNKITVHSNKKLGMKDNFETKKNFENSVRVTSNIIKLTDGRLGVYACSAFGFLLLKAEKEQQAKKLKAGTCLRIDEKKINHSLRDKKSGALVVELE